VFASRVIADSDVSPSPRNFPCPGGARWKSASPHRSAALSRGFVCRRTRAPVASRCHCTPESDSTRAANPPEHRGSISFELPSWVRRSPCCAVESDAPLACAGGRRNVEHKRCPHMEHVGTARTRWRQYGTRCRRLTN
jgi:hypothetical protein